MARAKKPTNDPAPKRASKKKRALADLPPQPDPRAPLDTALLIASLQPVRALLEDDLLARARESRALTLALEARHAADRAAQRTADAFPVWQRRFVEQVAAAWILSAIFIRTLEDRGLLEHARIAGPGAMDAQRSFLELAPSLSEREYLLTLFREMTRLPAAAALFDHHDPVWMLAPSADGARALLQLFRMGGDEAPALRFGQPDTRFLGDLYQDLNESVRERFALLQTPHFVERFILERTLEPALLAFGLPETDLVDPTCGSGHFLLGAFDRLFECVAAAHPHLSPRDAALAALDKVYGADINPYAVAIAKFRLTLSFLEKAGFDRIADAPGLPLHVVVADSLLYNPQHEQRDFAFLPGVEAAFERRAFDFEDAAEARAVLERTYAAVVGNPPYITVKDAALRERYRKLYRSAAGKYSLSAPFCERFFQLAKNGGRVGQITANSFMKREFGKKLIEDYLPSVDLDLIVNTSGAYIPGHGTPTVLLFGAHQPPVEPTVRAVLAKRGEPSTPEDPAKGQVWSSIVAHVDQLGFEDEFLSVADVERKVLAQHPWSLGGGGAAELKALLEERAEKTLGDLGVVIGFGAVTREDDAFLVGNGTLERWRIPNDNRRRLVAGEDVRDWSLSDEPNALWPYDPRTLAPVDSSDVERALWPWRRQLSVRVAFGKTQLERGLPWFAYSMLFTERMRTPLTITYAEVATHNHFVLDRGGKVFKQTAPIIKLPPTATEDDHLALLAYLNSSTACFWMKQVSFPKGSTAVNRNHPDAARATYAFSGTALSALPIPEFGEHRPRLIALASKIVALCARRACLLGPGHGTLAASAHGETPAESIDWALWDQLRDEAIVLQEEVDWTVYKLFALVTSNEVAATPLDGLRCPRGQRPFELVEGVRSLIRRGGETLSINESEAPVYEQRSCALDSLWQKRESAVRTSALLALLEQLEFKRLWRDTQQNLPELEFRANREVESLRSAVLSTAEQVLRQADTLVVSAASLRHQLLLSHASPLQALATRLEVAPESLVREVLNDAAVPHAAALRYSRIGLDKRAAWERTWALQRREDAGETVGDIPVPPKYDPKDFRDPAYYRLRGKLDVPKERFISYPGCESDDDREPVYGWAGWDHAQRASALVALYNDRKLRQSWPKERLVPLLAGLLELLPWLHQWHSDPMPDYDTTVSEAYEAFLDTELRALELTREHLTTWHPPDRSTRKGT